MIDKITYDLPGLQIHDEGVMSPAFEPINPYRCTPDHLIREFATEVSLMVENDGGRDVGELVEKLLTGMQGAAEDRAKAKPHILVYINLLTIAPMLIGGGMLYQRILTMEDKVRSMQGSEIVAVQVNQLQSSLNRLEERLNRYLDNEPKK